MRSRITLGLLGLLSLFVLVSLIIAWPQLQAQAQDTSALEEVVSLRARNRKVFRHVGWSQAVDGWQLERYTMQVSVGSLHYLDENGQWQDVDATPVDTGTEYRVDKVNAPVRLPKVATAPMVIKVGNETVTVRMVGAEPVAASLQGDRVLFADVYPQTDIAYQAEADGVREFLTLKGWGHPTAFTYQVETPLAVSIEQGEVVFRDRSGEPVGQFYRPFVVASPTETRWGEFRLDGNRLTMTLPDLTGLSYPITVDPTFYRRVSAGIDDGFAVPAWTWWSGGEVRVNFGRGYSGETYNPAIRWTDVTVPQGTEIVSAYVQFRSDANQSNNTVSVEILAAANNDNDPIDEPPNPYNEWLNTPRTTAFVSWTIPTWAAGSLYYTPNIASVIQEAINHPSFNDTFLLFFDDAGSSTGATRSAYSYEGNSSYAPELQVTYNVKTSHLWTRFTDRTNGTSEFYMLPSDVSSLQVDYAEDRGSGFGSYTTKFLTYLGSASPSVYCSGSWYYAEGRWRAQVSTQVQNIKWRVRVPSGKSVRDASCVSHTTTEAHSFWVTRQSSVGDIAPSGVHSYWVGLGIWP